MRFVQKAFNRLDFDEARSIAARVGFDVRACARTKKSCGPGCDYLVHDKRYYVSMLLRHIRMLLQSGKPLPDGVRPWYGRAQAAAEEYAEIEKTMFPVPARNP
jgi:hypothetical protein